MHIFGFIGGFRGRRFDHGRDHGGWWDDDDGYGYGYGYGGYCW